MQRIKEALHGKAEEFAHGLSLRRSFEALRLSCVNWRKQDTVIKVSQETSTAGLKGLRKGFELLAINPKAFERAALDSHVELVGDSGIRSSRGLLLRRPLRVWSSGQKEDDRIDDFLR